MSLPFLLTCVLANLFKKEVGLGRDRRKLLIWKATTGRGYRRSVRVCSMKLAKMFCELKNRTCKEIFFYTTMPPTFVAYTFA